MLRWCSARACMEACGYGASSTCSMGQHFAKDVDPLSKSMSPVRPCNAKKNSPSQGRPPQVCLDAKSAKVYSASLRLTALDKIHNAIRRSPLLCFAFCLGRQCADMILTTILLMKKSCMWPDRPLAIIKLDMRQAFGHLTCSAVVPARIRQMAGGEVMPVVGGRGCQEVQVGSARAGQN